MDAVRLEQHSGPELDELRELYAIGDQISESDLAAVRRNTATATWLDILRRRRDTLLAHKKAAAIQSLMEAKSRKKPHADALMDALLYLIEK